MLIHIPGLEGGEQHGRGDAPEHPPDQQPVEVGGQFCQAAESVDYCK